MSYLKLLCVVPFVVGIGCYLIIPRAYTGEKNIPDEMLEIYTNHDILYVNTKPIDGLYTIASESGDTHMHPSSWEQVIYWVADFTARDTDPYDSGMKCPDSCYEDMELVVCGQSENFICIELWIDGVFMFSREFPVWK